MTPRGKRRSSKEVHSVSLRDQETGQRAGPRKILEYPEKQEETTFAHHTSKLPLLQPKDKSHRLKRFKKDKMNQK